VGTEIASWNLGTLRPNETREVRFTMPASQAGMITHQAIAQHICPHAEAEARVVEAVSMIQTEIVSLPALLVSVVDEVDPVRVNEEVAYVIYVENQGTAPDTNVRLTIDLPQELEFIRVEGRTEAQAEGQQITLNPIEQLAPGDRVVWRLYARATQEGSVTLAVDMTSDNQTDPVRSEEPTRLFGDQQ
jgi:uncharacterized repeat protein (TIGR01451 family)